MTAFSYRDGQLHAEAVPLSRIAREVGTPAYVYSTAALAQTYRRFAAAFAGLPLTICYALKANSNQAVIATLAKLGAGADVVSEGEMRRALAAGIPAGRIIFSGVGKTVAEMEAALAAGLHQINVESLPELEALSAVATRLGVTAPVALRINPDVDAQTHAKIATGRREDKFGIDIAEAPAVYARAAALPGLAPVGVAVHIGSQLTRLAPFRAAFGHIAELVVQLRGQGIALSRVDLGGGIGIPYRADDTPPTPEEYAGLIREIIAPLGTDIAIEPGRALVGQAGLLLSRVLFVKPGHSRRFVILDAAMNDLLRPALYEAWHPIVPAAEAPAEAPLQDCDIVGPVCETGDTFARHRPLPPLAAGDLVAFLAAGAYGAVMASNYNSRPLVPEVLVDGDRLAIVRKRPTFDEMLAQEPLPDWLEAPVPDVPFPPP